MGAGSEGVHGQRSPAIAISGLYGYLTDTRTCGAEGRYICTLPTGLMHDTFRIALEYVILTLWRGRTANQWKLSQDHGCTVASLIELNPDLSNPNLLLVGDTIVVPNTFSESKGSSPPGVVAADTHVPPAQPSSKERSVHIASSHTPAVGDVSGEGTEADHLVKGQGAGLRAGWASSPWTRLAVKAGIRILVGVVLKQVLLPPSKKPAQRKK
eukprot:scaffold5540_cov390-Prasinococcus_capsulatus_cf.AAC.9